MHEEQSIDAVPKSDPEETISRFNFIRKTPKRFYLIYHLSQIETEFGHSIRTRFMHTHSPSPGTNITETMTNPVLTQHIRRAENLKKKKR